MVFETLAIHQEGAAMFVEIAAPPMNLFGPELARDLGSLIHQAEADASVRVLVFRSADRDYFISHVDLTRVNELREEAAKLDEKSVGLLFHHLSKNNFTDWVRSYSSTWVEPGAASGEALGAVGGLVRCR